MSNFQSNYSDKKLSKYKFQSCNFDVNNSRKLGISGIQSSFTLQHSTPIYTVPKDNRFKFNQSMTTFSSGANISNHNDPYNFANDSFIQKDKRSTVLGYGSKTDFSKSPAKEGLGLIVSKAYLILESLFLFLDQEIH